MEPDKKSTGPQSAKHRVHPDKKSPGPQSAKHRVHLTPTVLQALIVNIDGLLGGFRGSLTPGNHEALVMLVAGEATLQLEKVVMKSTFNRLGEDSTNSQNNF